MRLSDIGPDSDADLLASVRLSLTESRYDMLCELVVEAQRAHANFHLLDLMGLVPPGYTHERMLEQEAEAREITNQALNSVWC